jgi:hypothetical protein
MVHRAAAQLTHSRSITSSVNHAHEFKPMGYEQSFREDIIDRLARIETLLVHHADHSKRIAALEKWRIYTIAFASGIAMAGHYLVQMALNALNVSVR